MSHLGGWGEFPQTKQLFSLSTPKRILLPPPPPHQFCTPSCLCMFHHIGVPGMVPLGLELIYNKIFVFNVGVI